MSLEMWIWLGVFLLLVIVEIATTGLTTIWFAAGSLIAFILACLKAPLWAQIVAFVVISVVLLIFTRPILMKVLKVGNTRTNVDELIGKTAKVISQIDNLQGKGDAIVNGQEWTARAQRDDMIIAEDTMVEIVAISGVKLVVKPIEQ